MPRILAGFAAVGAVCVALLAVAGCSGPSSPGPAGAAGASHSASSAPDATQVPPGGSAIGSPGAGAGAGAGVGTAAIVLPPAGAVADYQLGGSYDPDPAVRIVTRDSTAEPASGIYSICYVNGFQSQPGAEWPAALLVNDMSGAPITDPGWPDEHIFDTSTSAKRAQLLDGLQPSIDGCRASGFQAIEFDNLDSYTRSHGALSADDAVAFATSLVAAAHASGLAAAQKNSVDLVDAGVHTVGFDFAMTEECFQFSECAAYAQGYGDRVIDVEYTSDLTTSFDQVCASSSRAPSTMLRDRQLTPVGDPGHVYRHC